MSPAKPAPVNIGKGKNAAGTRNAHHGGEDEGDNDGDNKKNKDASVNCENHCKWVECWNAWNDQTLFLLPYLAISYHI